MRSTVDVKPGLVELTPISEIGKTGFELPAQNCVFDADWS
jgi:hypothetical protein